MSDQSNFLVKNNFCPTLHLVQFNLMKLTSIIFLEVALIQYLTKQLLTHRYTTKIYESCHTKILQEILSRPKLTSTTVQYAIFWAQRPYTHGSALQTNLKNCSCKALRQTCQRKRSTKKSAIH